MARVKSPESPTGRGFDHHKRSASVRLERDIGSYNVYALGEWAQTKDRYNLAKLLASLPSTVVPDES